MDELDEVQVERIRRALVLTRGELEAQLVANREGARPVDLGLPIGRISRMDAMQQQQMARASRHAAELRLNQVGAALTAIERGIYGECRRCEEPIGLRRLQARPEAPFCLECQREVESTR